MITDNEEYKTIKSTRISRVGIHTKEAHEVINDREFYFDIGAQAAETVLKKQVEILVLALKGICKEYKQGADSGDWGNWSAEENEDYSKAMYVLNHAETAKWTS